MSDEKQKPAPPKQEPPKEKPKEQTPPGGPATIVVPPNQR